MWIKATYPSSNPTPGTPFSQAVIWDTIINSPSQSQPFSPTAYFDQLFGKSKPTKKGNRFRKPSGKKEDAKSEPGIVRLNNSKPKYQITDISGIISERSNVTLEVGWNVQPWVGALTWTTDNRQEFWRWKGVKGGRSQSFNMPAIKGKSSSATSEVVVSSEEPPKAAKASAII